MASSSTSSTESRKLSWMDLSASDAPALGEAHLLPPGTDLLVGGDSVTTNAQEANALEPAEEAAPEGSPGQPANAADLAEESEGNNWSAD